MNLWVLSNFKTDKKAPPWSPAEIFEDFYEDWLTELDRDDKITWEYFSATIYSQTLGMNNTEVSKIYQLHTGHVATCSICRLLNWLFLWLGSRIDQVDNGIPMC